MVLASIYLLIVFLCAVGTRDDGNNNVGVSQPWGARSVSCTDSRDVSAVWYIGRNYPRINMQFYGYKHDRSKYLHQYTP